MRVSHILCLTKEDAENILKELQNGASFDEMAREKSMDPRHNVAGYRYFPKGQLMPEFEEGCANLEVGQISGIVKTKLGYHIIKLTDKKDPELKPLLKVKEDIKARLRTAKRQTVFNKMLEKLKMKR